MNINNAYKVYTFLYNPTILHGQGQVHAGTPHTPTSSVSIRGLHKQQAALKEETSMEMSPTSTDVSEWSRSLLSLQKVVSIPYKRV